jgi:hypothetical protein
VVTDDGEFLFAAVIYVFNEILQLILLDLISIIPYSANVLTDVKLE